MRIAVLILTAFLLSGCTQSDPPDEQTESVVQDEPLTEPFDPRAEHPPGNPDIGREYFRGENRGRCLTCHSLSGEGEPTGWVLDDSGLRRDEQWLMIFIDSPRMLRPEVVRMPPFRGDEVATIPDVVAYLMTLTTPVEHPEHDDELPLGEPEMWEGGV